MVGYCLDTSVLIDILKENQEIVDRLEDLLGESNLFLSSISLCELYKGIYLYAKGEKLNQELNDLKFLLETFELVTFDENSCEEFGKFFSELKKKGKPIPELDIMIASIVKANNLTLVTRDKHFKKLGINIVVV